MAVVEYGVWTSRDSFQPHLFCGSVISNLKVTRWLLSVWLTFLENVVIVVYFKTDRGPLRISPSVKAVNCFSKCISSFTVFLYLVFKYKII